MTDDREEPRYYRVDEDPTEYALWLDFRKHGDLSGVTADEVPALVRAGREVWSFGYGWDQGELDPGEYTVIDEGDLHWFEDPLDRGVVDSWGPFAVSPLDETIVTIWVDLPNGTRTPFSVDTESIARRDALVGELLRHGLTPTTSAPEEES